MAGISVTFLSQTASLQFTVAQKSCHPHESQTPVFGQGRLAGAREGAVGSDLSHQGAFDLGIKHFPVFTQGGGRDTVSAETRDETANLGRAPR